MTERAAALALLALLVGAVALRTLVLRTVTVTSSSMAPTLLAGDTVLVSRLHTPVVGDVVAVELDGVVHVKRVVLIGPGEVELSRGRLYVDGEAARTGETGEVTWTDTDCRERTTATASERWGGREGQVVEGGRHARTSVEPGALWLLGDHRGSSSDARHWGPVHASAVIGVVVGLAWSDGGCGPPRWNRLGWWA